MKALRGYPHRIIVFTMAMFVYSGTCAAVPSGDVNGDGKVSVVDVLMALRIVIGLDLMTPQALERCDIAPVDTNGVPHPDSRITLEDALYVLQKSLSIPSWRIPSKVTVPNLVGQTQSAAQASLNSSLLSTGTITTQANATVASGNVISQNPVADASAEPGSAVNLVVSTGAALVIVSDVILPDLVGQSQAAAQSAITAAGLVVGTITSQASATVAGGNVISQNPAVAASVAPGSAVNLVVSTGPTPVIVPNVVGQAQAAAQTAINAAGLVVGTSKTQNSATVASGCVISLDPVVGTPVAAGSAINLVVSLGPASLEPIPPDPTTIAPHLDRTTAPSLAAATAFLYSGPNAIQTGVAEGTIDFRRAAVLRGKVMDGNNLPLSGVNITVKDHSEFGETYTRADGGFDLAVNGGGYLTISYHKSGYLPSQRQVNAPWQDYAWLPEVILAQLDSRVTTVDLASNLPVQSVRGNPVTDADGTRQATLLISRGTTAQMGLPNGSTIPLTTLNIRATEYTVGENGPKAMPGQLTSAYTYAVEFSADEAISAGATKLSFSQPIYAYVDDFIGFPVGSAVPAGYYDRQKGQWIASENGKVIKILSISAGMVDLDVDGSGSIASQAALAFLHINDAERTTLATLYPTAPKQLWRVPITHFTPWDCNWPYGPPPDAENPPEIDDPTFFSVEDPDCDEGSIIECQNRVLGESVPISGTPYTLNYRSSRTPGFLVSGKLSLKLSGTSVPVSLKAIRVTLTLAGRQEVFYFPALPNQVFNYDWDRRDCYGRFVGSSRFMVEIGYDYQAVYYPVSAVLGNAFARVQGSSGTAGITGNRQECTITLTRAYAGMLGKSGAANDLLPLWSLDVHHSYNPGQATIYYGNGESAKSPRTAFDIVETLGTVYNSHNLALGPDASIYTTPASTQVVRRGADGAVTNVAGNGSYGFSGDDGPATAATFSNVQAIAIGPEGALYLADTKNDRIRKVGTDGIVRTVAGNGVRGFGGDGGPATSASLNYPSGLAVAGDGSLYIADGGNFRVRKVGPDGTISTVAGNGASPYGQVITGDGGIATQGAESPNQIAVAEDGKIYYSEYYRVRRVGTDGRVTTVAGTGNNGYDSNWSWIGNDADGVPATTVTLSPDCLALHRDGSLYISAWGTIRRVDQNGIISTVAGGGTVPFADGIAAKAIGMQIWGLAVAPDGLIYALEGRTAEGSSGYFAIFRIRPVYPGFSSGDQLIASPGGAEIYHFDNAGRHLRTLNALTGAELRSFSYDTTGQLISITEDSGGVTTIERDAFGVPLAIVSPFGRRTTVTLDANGHVATLTSPDGMAHLMRYTTEGLLLSFSDPVGATSLMSYDASGRLVRDTNALGGFWALAETKMVSGGLVSLT